MSVDRALPERYISVLTSMRGIAALAVVLFHATIAFGASRLLLDRIDLLKAAVTFFFVLSGFVLTLSWRGDSMPSAFWWRRAARLLPLYVLAWLLTLAGRSYVHWDSSQLELVASLLLVQAWLPGDLLPMAVNPPAWSLSCEAAFYLALPLIAPRVLALDQRRLRLASAGVAAWLLVAVALSSVLPLEWWPGYRGAEFGTGVLLAAYVRSGTRPGALVRGSGAVSGLALLVIAGSGLIPSGPVTNMIALPSFVCVIAFCATSPADARRLDNPIMQALGRWSYSLYITHWVIVVLMSRFLTHALWIPVSLAVCVGAAAVLHRLVERPLERKILQVRKRRIPTEVNRLTPDDHPLHLL